MSLATWVYQSTNQVDSMPGRSYCESARDSLRQTFSPGSSESTRVFYVNGFEVDAFVNDLLGYSTLGVPVATVYPIMRTLPDSDPLNPIFYAYDCTVQPTTPVSVINGTRSAEWDIVTVTAKYRPVSYAVLADNQIGHGSTLTEMDRFTERTYEVSTEFVSVQGNMKFVRTGRVMQKQPGRYVTKMVKTMTWRNVPAKATLQYEPPNSTAIYSCIGRVNSVAFDINQGAHPPGTVLCLGVEPRLQLPKLGGSAHYFDITMKFQIFNMGVKSLYPPPDTVIGHNWIFDQIGILPDPPIPATPPSWDIITSNGAITGARLYEQVDLNTLWNVG